MTNKTLIIEVEIWIIQKTVTLGLGPFSFEAEKSMMTDLCIDVLKYINHLNNDKFQHSVFKYQSTFEEKEEEVGWKYKLHATPGTFGLNWFRYKNKHFYISQEVTSRDDFILLIGTYRGNQQWPSSRWSRQCVRSNDGRSKQKF